jgi:hypothetical protein
MKTALMPLMAYPAANTRHTDNIGCGDSGGEAWENAAYAKTVTAKSAIRPIRHNSFQTILMPNLL